MPRAIRKHQEQGLSEFFGIGDDGVDRAGDVSICNEESRIVSESKPNIMESNILVTQVIIRNSFAEAIYILHAGLGAPQIDKRVSGTLVV